jgi:tripeptide aminopeptidase
MTTRDTPALDLAIDRERALGHLMDLLAIEGTSGKERAVAEAVRAKLLAAGCKPAWIRHDSAHRRIDASWEVGNLIVKVPGSRGRTREPRILFMGHLDTVPLCRGAVPIRRGGRIESKGETALGGDNRTAVGALVTMVETVIGRDLPHPPFTVLFTIGEEVGLEGSGAVRLEDLGGAVMGFNVDGGDPTKVTIGAIGADRWQIEIFGRSAHAGVHPEDGVSATLIAARAIAALAEGGWFGKIEKGKKLGTSNVGSIAGGEASNQVTDRVRVTGECRSHDARFLGRITAAYRQAFEKAARELRNASGIRGRIEFRTERDYEAFRLPKTSPPVGRALSAIRALGLEPGYRIANGGLDANKLSARGIPTVTLGAGQYRPHTVDEYVEIDDYLTGAQLLTHLATS